MADVIAARLKLDGQAAFSAGAKRASSDIEGIGTSAEKTNKKGSDALAKLGAAGSFIGKWAKRGGLAVGALGATGVTMGLKFNASLESAQTRFQLFTKNAAEARKIVAGVAKVAASSTFGRDELSDVAAQLGTAGVSGNKLQKTMQGVTNAAAAAGGGSENLGRITTAMRQIATSGTLASGDIDQLADAGINVRGVLQKQFHLSSKEMENLGNQGIKSKDAMDVLTKYFTSGKMAHAAAAQANTVAGQFSNLKGRTIRTLGTLTKPLYDYLAKSVLPMATKVSKAIAAWAEKGGLQKFFASLKSNPAFLAFITALGVGFKIAATAVKILVDNWGTIKTILAILSPLIALIIVYNGIMAIASAATIAWALAQLALDAAMSANPIGLIIAAIVVLVAGLVMAYNKVGWFHNAVDAMAHGVTAAFNWVKNAAISVFNWIKGNWPLLVGILGGPFGVAVALVITHFNKIKGAAESVFNSVKSIFGKIPGIIKGIFSGAGNFAGDVGRSIANWLNANTPFGDSVHLGPVHFTIPALAEGGLVAQGGTALVGERGPELVTLPTGAAVMPLPSVTAQAHTVNVPVYLDRRQIALATGEYYADQAARKGKKP